MFIVLLIIITSVISCARYLNIIQINLFHFSSYSNNINLSVNPTTSYIISILTIFLIVFIFKPLSLISAICLLN